MIKSYEFQTSSGARWQGTQLPGRRAWTLFKRLFAMLGPAIGEIASSDAALRNASVGAALRHVAGALVEADQGEVLIDQLLAGTQRHDAATGRWVGYSSAAFDDWFAGNLNEMFEVLIRVLSENYGDFLSGRLGALITAQQGTGTPSGTES